MVVMKVKKGLIYTMEARRERIHKASDMLSTMMPCDYNRAVAVLSMALGIREEKAREYIRIIREVEGIIVEEGILKREIKPTIIT